MDWREDGIVLGARRHGETSAIVDLFTRHHGRHAGLVRAGRSRRLRPVLQPGNIVDAHWRARLEDQLGTFNLEPRQFHAATVMDDPKMLAALTTLTGLCSFLAERDPHPTLFDGAVLVLDNLTDNDIWPPLLVRWEAGLLDELGFGLDLSRCAATGVEDDLVYVSPKTGRAVSRDAGSPYREKLLRLPPFLLGSRSISPMDIEDGFKLTGFFLHRHLAEARGKALPQGRERLAATFTSQTDD